MSKTVKPTTKRDTEYRKRLREKGFTFIGVWLDAETWARLKAIAAGCGGTQAEVVRGLIQDAHIPRTP